MKYDENGKAVLDGPKVIRTASHRISTFQQEYEYMSIFGPSIGRRFVAICDNCGEVGMARTNDEAIERLKKKPCI